MHMRGLIVSAFMLIGCIQAFGQENRKEVCIGFPVGNSTLDTAYGNNAASLSDVVSFLESVKKDSTLELVEVSFCGSASPEGGLAINRKLAEKRRNSLERYVRERVSLPNSVISRPEGFIAWERLAELVEVSDMPHKEEALDVLRNVPEFTYNNKGVLVDSRKKRLMELQYGRTWRYMYKHFLPNPQCQCDSRDSPSKTSNRGKKGCQGREGRAGRASSCRHDSRCGGRGHARGGFP